MPTVTTRYVIYASRRRRHGGGGIIQIQPPSNSSLANGDIYQVPPSFPTLPWTDSSGNEQLLQFAFWSVTGGTNGPVVSFGGQPSPSIPVGNDAIVATAWYIQPGSGDGDGTGIIIDAFDEAIGDFVFDDFVTVAPGDTAFNTAANWDGYVPTTVAEAITAYTSIHGLPFHLWKKIATIQPTVTVNNMVVQASAGSVAFAIAFYKPSSGGGIGGGIRDLNIKAGTWVSWGVMVDGGGPTGDGPVGPWDPTMREFAAAMALMEVATKMNKELGEQAMALAAKQVELAAKGISAKMNAVKFNTRQK